MKITRLPFSQVPQLSKIDVAYTVGDAALRPFYNYDTSIEAFRRVMEDKKKDASNREVLCDALRLQYNGLDVHPRVAVQMERLASPDTFTVATAHQPALFTGPLYYVYKIFSTIHLAEQLNRAYPDCHFVPVFVSGAEDHDFEEINTIHLYNKSITWHNEAQGAVGAMSAATLAPVLEELGNVLGDSDAAKAVFERIHRAYTSHDTYGRATLDLLNALFGEYGLVVVDMNTPLLKKLFVPQMEKELLEQPSQAWVEKAQRELEQVGFGAQAHAREINLFYLRNQLRERIVQEDDRYRVWNTDLVFSREEILHELHEHPERFSPNVILRPLYQEIVLPNLAYIGGGGEIAYWLERKEQFRHFGVNFPMLVRRNSVWWIDEAGAKRMQKLGLPPEALFEETESLIKRYVADNTEKEISLEEEKNRIEEIFEKVLHKAVDIDATLEKAVLAEKTKQLNALENLEAKLMRAEKQRQDTSVQQIRSLREKYFPGNGLQERKDNFLPLYIKHGKNLFDVLLKELDPLQPGFILVSEQED
ncbi:MAG: bacillithiol biosynthesis cysteine-adding enzyme BshC [Saprospiraceae bacterium]|nr:bacillithiol biosynthesis cysteine-adding enzyme BshC [Saprospiraceae bacterium]